MRFHGHRVTPLFARGNERHRVDNAMHRLRFTGFNKPTPVLDAAFLQQKRSEEPRRGKRKIRKKSLQCHVEEWKLAESESFKFIKNRIKLPERQKRQW